VHVARPDHAALERAVRWVVLVVSTVLAMTIVLVVVVTSSARADDGNGPGGGPDQTGPDQEQLVKQFQQAQLTGTPTGMAKNPQGQDVWVGVPGTHVATHVYGYPYPAAGDCNEATLGGGCMGDARGFLQGQCTSWVAFRVAARNGLSFSNWYAGRHWGNASEWAKVAKSIGKKPDKTPAIGSIGWYKRGHVSYVEDVYYGGAILISEMNTDGHNGFHFTTVSPGMRGYPDKFIHLDDVVPVDTTPPTVPTDVRVVAHRGRTGITWRSSTDAFGVAAYRVLRNGVPLGTTRGTSFWDRTPPAGQSAVYSVVAYDAVGHSSRPGNARTVPGSEAVDRAWVATSAGPAQCGRTGTPAEPRVSCSVLTSTGWRTSTAPDRTDWGTALSRAFVARHDGTVAFCRTLGRPGQLRAACRTFTPETSTWAADEVSSDRIGRLPADATWVAAAAGPALCWSPATGVRGGCQVLTGFGWHTAKLSKKADPGAADSRAFLVDRGGNVSWCRVTGHGRMVACAALRATGNGWETGRSAHIARALRYGSTLNRAWVPTSAGPALCGRTGTVKQQRVGCHVLTSTGWRFTGSQRTPWGLPGYRAFVPSGAGVAYCRTVAVKKGTAVSCTRMSRLDWGVTRTSRRASLPLADAF
jgi:hypothetical protein